MKPSYNLVSCFVIYDSMVPTGFNEFRKFSMTLASSLLQYSIKEKMFIQQNNIKYCDIYIIGFHNFPIGTCQLACNILVIVVFF